MKHYVVLDTNVIVSALITPNKLSPTVILLNRIITEDDVIIILNDDILKEYKEVLHRKKFALEEHYVDIFIAKLETISRKVKGKDFSKEIPDIKDLMFISVSLAVPKSTIITGNVKHFQNLPNVMTPAEFLNYINNQ